MTLIAVLVALVIVAITLATGIKAAGALTGNARRLTDVTAAQWCAENQLANLKLSRQFPGVGDSDFSCSQLGVDYFGTLTVRPTPNPNFRRVDAVRRRRGASLRRIAGRARGASAVRWPARS